MTGSEPTRLVVAAEEGPVWVCCQQCRQLGYGKRFRRHLSVCPHCGWHAPLDAPARLRLLLDQGSVQLLPAPQVPEDPLDDVSYLLRLAAKLRLPVITLVDTPGAYPRPPAETGKAEAGGQAHLDPVCRALAEAVRTVPSPMSRVRISVGDTTVEVEWPQPVPVAPAPTAVVMPAVHAAAHDPCTRRRRSRRGNPSPPGPAGRPRMVGPARRGGTAQSGRRRHPGRPAPRQG